VTGKQRMNRSHGQQIRQAIKQLNEAEIPVRAREAEELLSQILGALTDLEAPLVQLIEKGHVPHPDGDERETSAIARRSLKQLRNAIGHALGED
jgi:hypothetical protein